MVRKWSTVPISLSYTTHLLVGMFWCLVESLRDETLRIGLSAEVWHGATETGGSSSAGFGEAVKGLYRALNRQFFCRPTYAGVYARGQHAP
jgi:hypothetical protein